MHTSIITSARQLFAIALTIIGISFSQNTQAADETICKLITCGHTYIDPNIGPNVLTGETQTIRVFVRFGNFVTAANAGVVGISATIGAKEGGGVADFDGCQTWVDVNLAIGEGVGEQNNVVITLIGVANRVNSTFRINVKRKPTVSTVTIKENNVAVTQVVAGRFYQIAVSGSNLSGLTEGLVPNDSHIETLNQIAPRTETDIAFNITFNTTAQVTLTSIQFKENKTDCHHAIIKNLTTPIILFLKPDLIATTLIGKYTLNSTQSCGGSLGKVSSDLGTIVHVKAAIGTPSTNQAVISKEIIWPNITWSVKNTGGGIIGSFKVQLKNGNTILQEETITNMANNETKSFVFTRPKSKKELMRLLSCGNGNDVHANQSNATNPDYNWADPAQFTVKVDALNNITESNETNNQNNY